MEKQNSLFDYLLEKLPRSPEEVELRNVIDYVWTDGEQILWVVKAMQIFWQIFSKVLTVRCLWPNGTILKKIRKITIRMSLPAGGMSI